jgi:methenyltetrahydromethanopterin cyclohydrolase
MPSSMSIVMNNVLVNIAITTSIHISVCICGEVVESTIINPS